MPTDFFDGFDDYPGVSTAGVGLGAVWTLPNGSDWLGIASPGRVGGQCVNLGASAIRAIQHRLVATTQISHFFAWKFGSYGGTSEQLIYSVRNSTNVENIGLYHDSTGHNLIVKIRGVIVATIANTVPDNTWIGFSVVCELHATLGKLQVRVNGELIVDISNVNTTFATGAADPYWVYFWFPNGRATYVDDVRCDYDTLVPIAEGRSVQKLPNADVSVMWSPLSGASNYLMIDEATCDSNTTYVVSSVKNNLDQIGFAGLGFNPDKIHLVQLSVAARKDDAATRVIGLAVNDGTSDYSAGNVFTGSDYQWSRKMFTPADFSLAEIDLAFLDSLTAKYEDLGDGT